MSRRRVRDALPHTHRGAGVSERLETVLVAVAMVALIVIVLWGIGVVG
jgi:hypothetical protein